MTELMVFMVFAVAGCAAMVIALGLVYFFSDEVTRQAIVDDMLGRREV